MIPRLATYRFVAVALVGALACGHKSESDKGATESSDKKTAEPAAKKTTELATGPYKLAIPDGWRDVHELQPDRPADPNEIAIQRDGDYEAIISLRYVPQAIELGANVGSNTTNCNDLAKAPGKKDADYRATDVTAVRAGDQDGCRWQFAVAHNAGIASIAKVDDQHVVSVKCNHGSKNAPDFDKVCGDVLALAHVQASGGDKLDDLQRKVDGEMLDLFTATRDAMCKCKAGDSACAKKVTDGQMKTEMAMVPDQMKLGETENSPELQQKLDPILHELAACQGKATDSAPAKK